MNKAAIKALIEAERRIAVVPLQNIEWRQSDSGDGSRILAGYAAVYEQETTLYAGQHYTVKEKLAYGAFNAVLAKNPDVHLNIQHDMARAIARTRVSGIGGLELKSDLHGLRVYSRLNKDDPDVQSLAAKMDLKIMDQMSFAFRVLSSGSEWHTTVDANGHETELRIINEVAELYDVCVCAQGAYPQTDAVLRSLLINVPGERSQEVLRAQVERSQEVLPGGVGAAVVSPAVDNQRIALLGRARWAKIQFREVN